MLKIKVLKGEQFKIGGRLVTLVDVRGPDLFVLEVRGAMIQQYQISARPPTEIFPGVKISAGRGDRPYRALVCIEAPMDVKIERMQKDPEHRFKTA